MWPVLMGASLEQVAEIADLPICRSGRTFLRILGVPRTCERKPHPSVTTSKTALTVALIVMNRVGSPQFTVWLIAPAMLWIVFDRARAHTAAALVLLLCVLTFCVYPLTYDGLLAAHGLPVLLLSLRNAMLVVLLVVAVRAVLRAPVPIR